MKFTIPRNFLIQGRQAVANEFENNRAKAELKSEYLVPPRNGPDRAARSETLAYLAQLEAPEPRRQAEAWSRIALPLIGTNPSPKQAFQVRTFVGCTLEERYLESEAVADAFIDGLHTVLI